MGRKGSAVAGLAGDGLQVSGDRDPSPLWRFNGDFATAAAAVQFRPPRSLLFI